MIILGAPKLKSLFNLLFLLISLLYKSFKSEVANLPPSRGTRGLKSGGITGITSNTIHSGLLLEFKNASTIFNFATIDFCLVSDLVSARFCLSLNAISSKFIFCNISLIAPAPISALKFSPNLFIISSYCSSDKICPYFNGVSPGSRTTYPS